MATIAIIGGTGVYGVAGMKACEEIEIDTPFGKPSSKIMIGEVSGLKIAFISRHDVGHRLIPSEIPFRANIYALKSIGVKYILSFGACGSLQEEVKPLDLVVADQFIDRTKFRPDSFFGEGVIVHSALGDPTCPEFSNLVFNSIKSLSISGSVTHKTGTYICIEGPAFSTRAESNMYRSWGGTVIGMTACPEYKLCREAEIAYAIVCLVTDYDCWHIDHNNVTVDQVIQTLKKNGENAQLIVKKVIEDFAALSAPLHSTAHDALKCSILTPADKISDENKKKLNVIAGRYWS